MLAGQQAYAVRFTSRRQLRNVEVGGGGPCYRVHVGSVRTANAAAFAPTPVGNPVAVSNVRGCLAANKILARLRRHRRQCLADQRYALLVCLNRAGQRQCRPAVILRVLGCCEFSSQSRTACADTRRTSSNAGQHRRVRSKAFGCRHAEHLRQDSFISLGSCATSQGRRRCAKF